jgi:hypothetical protein
MRMRVHKERSILFEEACTKVGRNARCAELYEEQMVAAGFTDVVATRYVWPCNRWPKDPKLKELGEQLIFHSQSQQLTFVRNVAVGKSGWWFRGS